MKKYIFKPTLVSALVASVVTTGVYAEEDIEKQEKQAIPSIINPHNQIGLTKPIAEKYSGKGVNIGVLDGGFMVEHTLVDRSKLHSVTFELTDSSGKKRLYAPHIYEIETEQDEEGNEKKVYSMHGGQVAGIIGAKSAAQHQYAGGIAKNSEIYITSIDPQKTEEDTSKSDDGRSDILLGETSDLKDGRRAFSTAINKLVEKNVLAINNSWNEDAATDSALELEQKYKEAIVQAKDNVLINAIKAAVQENTLMVFAAGNESKKQPGIMAALPQYLPELESHYLSVVGVDDGKNLSEYSNHCGVSKNWCVAAPGNLTVLATDGAEENKKYSGLKLDTGTSYSTPVVTGSLAILKERFNYFTPTQIRDTLFTTATDLGKKGVDDVFGWGLINLQKAVQGPSQLLRNETYNVTQNDIWTNSLQGKYRLTKQGAGELTLAGNNNHIKEIDVEKGKLALLGKTVSDNINNQGHLTAADLTVNKAFQSSSASHLEIWANNAFIAQGKNTMVNLAGTLLVAEALKQNAQEGQTLTNVLLVRNGANYQGGFDALQPSKILAEKGLRQDLYFKNDRIELKANSNKAFSDPKASGNAKHGLDALNALRDTKVAWRKGTYNNWLQHAVEHNDLQNFHYYIGNNIYADSLAFLRNQTINRLNGTSLSLHRHQDNVPESLKVWVEGNGQRYKSDQKQLDQKTEFKTRDNGFSIAYKVNDKALLIGNLTHLDTNLDKNQATGKIKQLEAGLALRYAQSSHGWFDDISGKIGQINYRQNRYFNGASLASGKNKGLQLSGELRRGYRLTANNWQIEPSLGLQAVHLSMRQLKEQGELATDTTAFHKTDVNLSGGLQVKHLFQFNDWAVTPNLSLNYTHRLNGKNNEIQSDLFGVKIKSKSEIYSKNIAEVGFGLTVEKNNWFTSAEFRQSKFKSGKASTWLAKFGVQF